MLCSGSGISFFLIWGCVLAASFNVRPGDPAVLLLLLSLLYLFIYLYFIYSFFLGGGGGGKLKVRLGLLLERKNVKMLRRFLFFLTSFFPIQFIAIGNITFKVVPASSARYLKIIQMSMKRYY